jgi:uncharacterized membrane protein (UPF0127 family)
MRIINKAKDTTLATAVIIANTLLKRVKGLLGRKTINKGEALILNPCNSIHTCFMRFPIDVLFVNRQNQVVKALSSIKPFHLTPIYFNAHFAIELPAGTIQSTSTSQGDLLLIG